jgi:DNA-binding transcriptional regulator of glucitol operon
MANPYWWQMAHYALGKLEIELGYQLTWRERSKFIKDFIEENDTELNQ